MKRSSNVKLYLFIAAMLVLGAALMVLRGAQESSPTNPDAAKGLPEWAQTAEEQQAWRDRAAKNLTWEAVMQSPDAARHQVVCWTGRFQDVVHSHSQEGLLITFEGRSAQSFVALMPARGRFDWRTPAKGVRVELCGEVLEVAAEPTPTMGQQPSPVLRAGFLTELR
jgi:hypothetical protein